MLEYINFINSYRINVGLNLRHCMITHYLLSFSVVNIYLDVSETSLKHRKFFHLKTLKFIRNGQVNYLLTQTEWKNYLGICLENRKNN